MRALVVVLLLSSVASARVVTFVARAGDTFESNAADYYGNRALALLLSEENGGRVVPGQRIRVPTAVTYKVKKGDTLELLAGRFLDDKRRVNALAQLAGMKPGDKLKEGQELTVPFVHRHVAGPGETLQSVSKLFYGDASKTKMLQEANFRPNTSLTKGERVVVPIAHVHVRAAKLALLASATPAAPKKPTPSLAAAPAKIVQEKETELAARVADALKEAERNYASGNYSDVASQLDKVLAAEDPSESQLADIFQMKAMSYVALGMDELAVSAFREVISRRPSIKLDEAMVSPKIRDALDKARANP